MKRNLLIIAVFLAVAAFCFLGLTLNWPQNMVGSFAYAVESGQAAAARSALQVSGHWETQFELAATAIEPSVVSITSSRTVKAPSMGTMLPRQFREFFGDERWFGQWFNGAPEHSLHQQALGSGVIVSKDGYILTNNHVVDGADDLMVQLSDNREFKAKLVGRDLKTDVAVVKIDAHDLTPAVLALNEPVRVGQWVLAVGDPFGLRETVTAGIISATGRANVGIADYEDFLQTDAAINPGNSGGPLIDVQGQVVGINTAIATHTGGYQGVGFAIPVSLAHNVMQQLITTGKVTRAYLGVVIQPLTAELAKSFGYPKEHGILIAQVTPDGPAAKAGLKNGDIITSLDGRAADDFSTFRGDVAQTAPGTKVKLEVWRNGKSMECTVTLEEMPASVAPGGDHAQIEDLGLTLGNPTPSLARQYNLSPDVKGALVLSVNPGSTAELAGLHAGDLIVEIQDKAVNGADDARTMLSAANLKDGVRMRVQRGDTTRYLFLKVQG